MNNKDYSGKYGKHFTYLASEYDFRFNVITSRFEYRKLTKGKPSKKFDWCSYDDKG